MFIFKLKELLLLSPIFWVPTMASVGFEFELPEFQLYSPENPNSIIPKRTILATRGKLWNMTADETEDGKDDLEIVTEPLNKFDHNNAAQEISTASKEIKDYLLSLFHAGQLSLTQKKTHVDFPSLTEKNNYAITYSAKGKDALIFPQVTFGILPSHFYNLSCGKNLEPEFLKYVIPDSKKEYQESQCRNLEEFFESEFFKTVPKNDDTTLRSFLTLFRQYVTIKSKEPLEYPKLVSGMFLSRVSFAEMFQQLPQEIKIIIIDFKLLREIVWFVRKEFKGEMVFPLGYRSTGTSAGPLKAMGPTLEAWIEGFTREVNPVDLLVKLDEDESMGQMPLDNLATTKGGELQKHWILELRGLPELSVNKIPDFMEKLFHFFSNFNGKTLNN